MKLKFKDQPFQLEAVRSVVDVFNGLELRNSSTFRLYEDKNKYMHEEYNLGFANPILNMSNEDILKNIKDIQKRNGLTYSNKLEGSGINLTIEMETGTGKTYTYIQSMYELNIKYGFSKFIVVVPSIAIREGVYTAFQMLEEHFQAKYGKKIRYFIYDSGNLTLIDTFASDNSIHCMIINSHAFNKINEDTKEKNVLIMFKEMDQFNTRKPIDVIADTRPILIIDEPQSVEGEATKKALKYFNPLFILRYSATHKEYYNQVYRLDALDAYNNKLVKKISVKGLSLHSNSGKNSYIYLEGIDIFKDKNPIARVEIEIKSGNGIKKVRKKIDKIGYDLYSNSGELQQYKGFVVSDINPRNNSISFKNGITISVGEVYGNIDEIYFRRIQIRHTIKSHFEKEKIRFKLGIKVLSLFFIDEVAKYRIYDENNEQQNGIYANIFEEEYKNQVEEYIQNNDEYSEYLKSINVNKTHNGYFSIDKKTKRMVDPTVKKKEESSEDVDAYDLIMRDKEKLLSFEEPTRFIFSHSALKEGWDNPNVFQICILRNTDSTYIRRRQEVGRGLRLCVDKNGDRVDSTYPGIDVHDTNVLTVIASESYENFATALQNEIIDSIKARPKTFNLEVIKQIKIIDQSGKEEKMDDMDVSMLFASLVKNNLIDKSGIPTNKLVDDIKNNALDLKEIVPEKFISATYNKLCEVAMVTSSKNLIEDENRNTIINSKTDKYDSKQFKELWKVISAKTIYQVEYSSNDLINQTVLKSNENLKINESYYTATTGTMDTNIKEDDLKSKKGFTIDKTEIINGKNENIKSYIKYDLIGKITNETKLTRKTVSEILKGVNKEIFDKYKRSPEEFIMNISKIINSVKAKIILDKINYIKLDLRYDQDEVFEKYNNIKSKYTDSIELQKHIYQFLITDSNIEKEFAKKLDELQNVIAFAKLPLSFVIPTPVGNYTPDWAIILDKPNQREIYFVAETKGSLIDEERRHVENAKIECAKKHFQAISGENIKYIVCEKIDDLIQRILE